LKENRNKKGIIELFWDAMDSMKFAVVLLVILTVVSLAGVILPQFPPDNFPGSLESLFLKKYGQVIGSLFLLAGFDHLFTAWWYYLLLVLLCLNVSVCSFKRLTRIIKIVKRTRFLETEPDFQEQSNNQVIELKLPLQEAAIRVKSVLVRSGYRIAAEKEAGEDNSYIYVKRGELGLFGPILTHTSMVVIMIGAALSYMLSFEHFQWMAQGEVIDVPDLSYMAQPSFQLELARKKLAEILGFDFKPSSLAEVDRAVRFDDWREFADSISLKEKFRVRLDRFQALFTPQGNPKAYLSTVSVLPPGNENKTLYSQVIKVNDPLIYEGVYFYQSSYAPSGRGADWVKLSGSLKDSLNSLNYELNLKPGGSFAGLGDSGDSIRIRRFVGNFRLNERNEVTDTGGQDLNPAVEVEVAQYGGKRFTGWVFKNFPNFSHSQNNPYTIVMGDYQKSFMTGLTIRTHRSQSVIWFGFALMITGVVLSFYLNHRQMWVMVKAGQSGQNSRVYLAGNSYKWKQQFTAEFDSVAEKIKGISAG
jgi:cytochrome c biogenesis protein